MLKPKSQLPNDFDQNIGGQRTAGGKYPHTQYCWCANRADVVKNTGTFAKFFEWQRRWCIQHQATDLVGQPQPKTNRQWVGDQGHASGYRYVATPPDAGGNSHHDLPRWQHKSPKHTDGCTPRNAFMVHSPQLGVQHTVGDRFKSGVNNQAGACRQRCTQSISPVLWGVYFGFGFVRLHRALVCLSWIFLWHCSLKNPLHDSGEAAAVGSGQSLILSEQAALPVWRASPV